MRFLPLLGAFILLLDCTLAAKSASAETLKQPSMVIQGSSDVLVGGKPTVRAGDGTASGDVVVEGSSDVFINGKPAVTAGDKTSCGGIVVGGSASVFVNGKPLVTSGTAVAPCPAK